MENKLYVGNLSYATTEDDLKILFSKAGTVTSVAVIKDRESGRSKGFAFVEMSSQAEAEKAINEFNGYTLGERDLRISIARPKEEGGRREFGGGQRRGGFGQRGGGNQGGQRDRNRNSRGGGSQRY
jgi:RNA recognition motif-containing protein